AALRWSLAKLRGLLGPDKIITDRDRAGVVDLPSDLARARTLATTADANIDDLRAATELFRGELLEGLELADCYRYHEWCTGQRESARALRMALLGSLVKRCAGDPEQALGWARQRVAIDPLSEAAHIAVIQLLAQAGRRREGYAQ